MRKRDESERQLERIYDELAESVLELTDEEILDEARSRGIDPVQEAEQVRVLMKNASGALRRQKLRDAQKQHQQRVDEMGQRKYMLPSGADERRRLLLSVLAKCPDISALTVQFRDFTDLPDEDIETVLKQLADLGLLER